MSIEWIEGLNSYIIIPKNAGLESSFTTALYFPSGEQNVFYMPASHTATQTLFLAHPSSA